MTGSAHLPADPAPAVGVVHVHSDYSHDGRDSLEDLREFALARGLRFVALTDHAEDFDAEKFARFTDGCARLSDDDVALIPGLEFRFAGHKGVHLLALGLRRWIVPASFEEFFQAVEGAVGLTIAAHPLLYRWSLPAAVAARIDAVEVWNAAYNTRYLPDPRAMQLLDRIRATRPEVVAIAGLDQHSARNDRGTRVIVRGDRADHPLAELRAGRFENRGRGFRFDSRASMSRVGRAGLLGARITLDLVNGLHERVARARRRRSNDG